MKLFNDLLLKFENPDWAWQPIFCVIDAVLENNPDIILMMKDDVVGNKPFSNFGRKDTPSVEQIVRSANL